MKKMTAVIVLFCIFLNIGGVFAQGEFVGTFTFKDGVVFINGCSIPSVQMPNGYVYIQADNLENYGFDVSKENGEYIINRNNKKTISPVIKSEEVKVYTSDVKVYLDSETPANVYETEDGEVIVQCDELAKYGSFDWNGEVGTIQIDFQDNVINFNSVAGISDINEIGSGAIVYEDGRCADLSQEDLNSFLSVYDGFVYDRVVGALPTTEYYIKLWNKDKTKSYIVYSNSGVIGGKYGEEFEYDGNIRNNYVYYLPYVGNARNALYTKNTEIYMKYKDSTKEFSDEYSADLPSDNLLMTIGCSDWAESEIQKAASLNLMIYDVQDMYREKITRRDFCKLAYRLIATEYNAESDSRMGAWNVIEKVIDERGLRDIYESTTFADDGYYEVQFLAAAGIVNGMGDGTFAPEENITREQAAAILYRMAEFLNKDTTPVSESIAYDDEYEISDWAKENVTMISQMGIMNGVGENKFEPDGTYTVEQAILTMSRLYKINLKN